MAAWLAFGRPPRRSVCGSQPTSICSAFDMIEGRYCFHLGAQRPLLQDHIDSPRPTSPQNQFASATLDPIDTEGSIRDLLFRMRPILQAAANTVLINFDMESHESKDLTLELVRRACELKTSAAWPCRPISGQAATTPA